MSPTAAGLRCRYHLTDDEVRPRGRSMQQSIQTPPHISPRTSPSRRRACCEVRSLRSKRRVPQVHPPRQTTSVRSSSTFTNRRSDTHVVRTFAPPCPKQAPSRRLARQLSGGERLYSQHMQRVREQQLEQERERERRSHSPRAEPRLISPSPRRRSGFQPAPFVERLYGDAQQRMDRLAVRIREASPSFHPAPHPRKPGASPNRALHAPSRSAPMPSRRQPIASPPSVQPSPAPAPAPEKVRSRPKLGAILAEHWEDSPPQAPWRPDGCDPALIQQSPSRRHWPQRRSPQVSNSASPKRSAPSPARSRASHDFSVDGGGSVADLAECTRGAMWSQEP
eukprot:TRINITY_DN42938_c0_g1_i1.p1 TRINITY_DN42938_c0_g1~~TRINITY_DN42938_c0_g1_i1.p1  ORF type:complete len:377 (+),score=59.51 TRINITY_DN42938_c0_g1_i1:122-1132(+)